MYPSPGSYEIDRNLIQKKYFNSTGKMTPFATSVRKKEIPLYNKEEVKSRVEQGIQLTGLRGGRREVRPGPGQYNPGTSLNSIN